MVSRAWAAVAAIFLVAGCRDGAGPATPSAVEIVVGKTQTGTVGGTVPQVPQFVVHDQNGQPLAGVAVTIAVTLGGGTLTGAPAVSAATPVAVGSWTLGTTVGPNVITITAGSLAPVTATADAKSGPPVSLALLDGDDQAAPAATALPQPIQLRMEDGFGNAASDVAVTFMVTGGGFLSSATALSNAQGIVAAPLWTLGRSDVPQEMFASTGPLSASIRARVQTDFLIEVRFAGPPMSASRQAIFANAAARLQAIVTNDLPDIQPPPSGLNVGQCLSSFAGVSHTTVIDDLVVYAIVEPIDGPGGILGSAGPCFIRSGGGLPVLGVMRFDDADVANLEFNGLLQDVIMHEMLHVLGVGTLWNFGGRALLVGANTPDVSYVGVEGIAGCAEIGGSGVCVNGVPVENQGGAGTVNLHWRETTFGRELMTGFVNSGSNPLSRITSRSLRDLGYEVNVAPADGYELPVFSPSRIPSAVGPAWEEVIRPVGRVDQTGRVEPLGNNQ